MKSVQEQRPTQKQPSKKDPEAWLEAAPEFSRPICATLREWILGWEPDLAEAIKWNLLMFSGRKMVCGLGAFKQHVSLLIFRGSELDDPAELFDRSEDDVGVRKLRFDAAHPLAAVNRAALRALLHAAVALDAEPALPALPRTSRPPPAVPEFLTARLQENAAAKTFFAQLPPSCQREYVNWLTSAKRPKTRERRLAQTLAALTAGRRWDQRQETR